MYLNCDDEYEQRVAEAIAAENLAVKRLNRAIATIIDGAVWYWHWGGDRGGDWVLDHFREKVIQAGLEWPFDQIERMARPNSKKKITHSLAKRVHEKHAYRCVHCGSHHDLCCDHILPESKGGATVFENLQTMCRSCNSRKGNRQ